ncbi:hypothetical protein DWX99_04625 [Firmicutes bacterium AF22-6AC]|jgi:hypothetical protein|nr:hypothetical protein DWX99_04625 [Firmicutes bacterium AF22-6AC]
MKRKILVTILSLIMGLSIVACGKQETTATTESVTAIVESTQAEPTETVEATENESTEKVESTETVENNTTENETETTETTESTEESTESTEEMLEAADITKGEPFSEKDLAFSFLGYNTYKEYIEAGNNGNAYIVADNAAMILSGEFTDDGDVLESTVRGIKLGDSIDKVFELYGQADMYDRCIKQYFAHDDLKDTDEYTYFLKLDSTKDYYYALTFFTDQYSDVIGVILEPIAMKYWSDDLT